MINWSDLFEKGLINFVERQLVQRAGSSASNQLAVFMAYRSLQNGNTVFSERDIPTFLPADLLNKADNMGKPDEDQPIIRLQSGHYQMERFYFQEKNILETFHQTSVFDRLQTQEKTDFLDSLQESETLSLEQIEAIKSVINHQKILLTGGPGTGKTFTIVRMLASLLHHKIVEPDHIALTAPTGKAASRMSESIRFSLRNLQISEKMKNDFPSEGLTLHRLLGISSNPLKATFNRQNPLPYNCVVIDEVSMMDTNLWFALMEAVKPDCRIIFVGDPDQLPSVEAGRSISDLCLIAEHIPDKLKRIHLLKSKRFESESGIAKLAQAVNRQETKVDLNSDDCRFIECGDTKRLHQILTKWFQEHLTAMHEATENEQLFELLRKKVILTALRSGSFGSEGINDFFGRWSVNRWGAHQNGKPIIINQNNYNLEVFNSDVGVLVNRNQQQRVIFEKGNQKIKEMNPLLIQSISDPAYAITVHKAQGSEYEEVLLVLPDLEENGLLSKELIYTAITRAKKKFTFVGSEKAFRKAIALKLERKSGISVRWESEN